MCCCLAALAARYDQHTQTQTHTSCTHTTPHQPTAHPTHLQGLHLIFRLYGSAVVRTALWGALAALQTTLLYTLVGDHLTHFFEDGRVMAFTVFSTMLGEGG